MKRLLKSASLVVTTLVGSMPAHAHIISSRLGDFYAGALHPLTDLQNVILWIAMGVLAGSLGAVTGRWLVIAFPAGLLAGLGLGLASGIVSAGPIADAAMITALGLALAANVRISPVPLLATAVALAMTRGMAHAGDITSETSLALYAAGLAATGYAAVTLVAAATVAFKGSEDEPKPGWHTIAIRAFGSWIAAIGMMMGGFALAS